MIPVVLENNPKPMVVGELVSINDICRVIITSKDFKFKKFFAWDIKRGIIVIFYEGECEDIGDVKDARYVISEHLRRGWTCSYYSTSEEMRKAR